MINSALPPICLEVRIIDPIPVINIDNQYTTELRVKSQQIKGAGAEFTVSDVEVGHWISNYSGGQAWKIISITSVNVNSNSLICIIEDVEYYNASLANTGTITSIKPEVGLIGYIWTLDENGLPSLYNVDPTILAENLDKKVTKIS